MRAVCVTLCVLSATAHARPFEELAHRHARDQLGATGELVATTRPLLDGALVELAPRIHGLRVLGRRALVRIDGRGNVAWSSSTLAPLPEVASTPALDVRAVVGDATIRESELVVWAPPGTSPRLAWYVTLEPDLAARTWWVVIADARTGEPIARRDRIQRAAGHRARVHAQNPVATPAPAEVTFVDLPAGATTLDGPDFRTTSCVDTRACQDFGGAAMHWCGFTQRAKTSATGDFLHLAPPPDPLDLADPYAEVALYHHATRAYAFHRSLLGASFELVGAPITLIANYQAPGEACPGPGAAPPSSQLARFDNAEYLPVGAGFPGMPGGALGIAQGTAVDLSLDGDVIAHELGHALQETLSPELGFAVADPRGLDTMQGGINEGTADYLANAQQGDSKLAEYVAQTFGLTELRDGVNDRACPEHLVGYAHTDGRIVNGALWEVRVGLAPTQRSAFDRAVVAAMATLDATSTYATFADAVLAEVSATLGDAIAADAALVFAARGLDGCRDRIRSLEPGEAHQQLRFEAARSMDDPTSPAVVQFHLELDRKTAAIEMSAEIPEGGSAEGMTLLLKPVSPITWTSSHDAPTSVALSVDGSRATARIAGPFAAGAYYLQLVSADASAGHALSEIAFRTPPEDSDGCGCSSAPAPASAVFAFMVLAVIVRSARKRDARRARTA